MTVFRLVAWTRFNDPVERVWEVKTDPDVVRAEFPFYARFDIDDPERLAQCFDRQEPCTVEGRLMPIGLRWPTRIERIDRPRLFRDSSENAMFRRFLHEHRFEPTTQGARYVDHVTFEPATSVPLALARVTERTFIHRHKVAARYLHPDPHCIAVTSLRELFEHELAGAFSPRDP